MSYWHKRKRTYDFSIEFSLSPSKIKQFIMCERKYALSSYGSWDTGAEALGLSVDMQIEVARLKKMDTLDSLTGSAVHSVISDIIRTKSEISNKPVEKSKDILFALLRDEYKNRRNNALVATQNALAGMSLNSEEKILKEIYFDNYDGKDSKEFKEKEIDIGRKLKTISNNLYDSDILKEALEPCTTLLLIESKKFPKVKWNGIDVYGNLDLLYKYRDSGIVTVVDWKTGNPDDESDKRQLLFYAFFIAQKFFCGDYEKVSNIMYINEYLNIRKRFTRFIEIRELHEFEEYFKMNILNIRNKLLIPEKNIPLHISQYERRIDVKYCNQCEMGKICQQIDGGDNNE